MGPNAFGIALKIFNTGFKAFTKSVLKSFRDFNIFEFLTNPEIALTTILMFRTNTCNPLLRFLITFPFFVKLRIAPTMLFILVTNLRKTPLSFPKVFVLFMKFSIGLIKALLRLLPKNFRTLTKFCPSPTTNPAKSPVIPAATAPNIPPKPGILKPSDLVFFSSFFSSFLPPFRAFNISRRFSSS